MLLTSRDHEHGTSAKDHASFVDSQIDGALHDIKDLPTK